MRLNWRWWLGLLCVVALSVPVSPAEAASRNRAATAKNTVKKSASVSKSVVTKKGSKQLKSTSVKTRKASAVTAAKAGKGKLARSGSAKAVSRQARSSSVQVRRVAYAGDTARRSLVQRVSVQAAPMASPSGRTVIASPQLATSARMSFGQLYGLHHTSDPLELKSSVALVIDQDTDEVLLSKNSEAVLPIASITKLMTALVVLDARQPMNEMLEITQEDVDTEKNSSSRLAVGTWLTRGEALHLALMSSENRAAHALGRHYPGGLRQFVSAMNGKSRQLGMFDSHFVDPTGLNSQNQSSARDLVSLVKAASQKTLIRELSVSMGYVLQSGSRLVQFKNTNSLVTDPTWEIGLQKTGYIVEAGRCLVMQARVLGRRFIMVFLDSAGKYSRLGDAERVRRWIETMGLEHLSSPAPQLGVHKATS